MNDCVRERQDLISYDLTKRFHKTRYGHIFQDNGFVNSRLCLGLLYWPTHWLMLASLELVWHASVTIFTVIDFSLQKLKSLL